MNISVVREPIKAVDKDHLLQLIRENIDAHGNECDLNHIDVSGITDMARLFEHFSSFNGSVSQWDVSNVKTMDRLFSGRYDEPSQFNGDISQWNVGNVENMRYLFNYSVFDQDISRWNVSNVKQMEHMFHGSKFNGDLSRWNVSQVRNMSSMFQNGLFNQNISMWNVGAVEVMGFMFSNSPFDWPLEAWDVSNVNNMMCMFASCPFNHPLNKWNVENVLNMCGMFRESSFNHPLNEWKPCSVGVRYLSSVHNLNTFNALRAVAMQAVRDKGLSIYVDAGHDALPVLNDRVYINKAQRLIFSSIDGTGIEGMFDSAAFSHDISMWPLAWNCNTKNIFRSNERGFLAQGTTPWFALHAAQYNSSVLDTALQAWLDMVKDHKLSTVELQWSVRDFFHLQLPPKQAITPATPMELRHLVEQEILWHGPNVDLNHIDVSHLTSLAGVFKNTSFTGNISQWNVSNCSSFVSMFENCPFNGDISKWNTSRANTMASMFKDSQFNGDVSQWDTSRVMNMEEMFMNSVFDQPIGNWDVRRVLIMQGMFENSHFTQNIANWTFTQKSNQTRSFYEASIFFDELDLDFRNKKGQEKKTMEEHAFAALNKNIIGRMMHTKIHQSQKEHPEWASLERMFKNSRFAHDISHWKMPADMSFRHMFDGNPEGLLAQTQLHPWVIKECIAQRIAPNDEAWKHIFTTGLNLVETLHDSLDDRLAEMTRLHEQQHQNVESFDIGMALD